MRNDILIPPPPVVRERLARHIREGRLLRSLLRLSIRAAEERHHVRGHHEPSQMSHELHHEATGQGVAHE